MKPRMIRFDVSIWEQAKIKADMIPLARIVRRLLELWLDGSINLSDYQEEPLAEKTQEK